MDAYRLLCDRLGYRAHRKRLIVVLSMHRSGSSAITRGLQALGVDLGEHLMSPNLYNEKGYFEDIELNALNVELQHSLDSDWHDLSLMPKGVFDDERLDGYQLRAIELLTDKVGDRPFGLKDPRIPRLLPFWMQVFGRMGIDVSYVIVVRNPISVAQSLKKRDGFEVEKSYYLWLEHILPAVLETVGANRVVVEFDLMMADPKMQLERMARTLDLPFYPESPEVNEYVNEFLDKGLRHTQFQVEDLSMDSAIPPDVIKAFEVLLRVARDEMPIDSPEVDNIFAQINTSLAALAPALNYMVRFDFRAQAL